MLLVGPARFKLPRTVATLWLPHKVQDHTASDTTATTAVEDAAAQFPRMQSLQQQPVFDPHTASLSRCAEPVMDRHPAVEASSNKPVVQDVSNAGSDLPDSDQVMCPPISTAASQVDEQPQLVIHELHTKAPKRNLQSTASTRQPKT